MQPKQVLKSISTLINKWDVDFSKANISSLGLVKIRIIWGICMKYWLLILLLLASHALLANDEDIYYQSDDVQYELRLLSDNIEYLKGHYTDAYHVSTNTIILIGLQGLVTLAKIKLMNTCFSDHEIIHAIEVNQSSVGILQASRILSCAIDYLAYTFHHFESITIEMILQEIVHQTSINQ